MREIVTLLMTSRSGSSMVADIYRQHGFFWARNEKANPLVGGRKVRYNSFENQVVKAFNKQHFGTPLGPLVTYDDNILTAFHELVKMEYGRADRAMWKGAVEFFPLWQGLMNRGVVVRPVIIWRPMQAVMDSLRAKRGGSVDEQKLLEITQARYETLSMLAADYAFPVVETDKLVKGDMSSLQQAFDCYGHGLDEALAHRIIQPSKWETDR